MTTVNRVLAIAQRELGLQEQPTNMTKYGEWYDTNGEPWCATFVSYCLYHAGFRLSIQPNKSDKGFGYCPSGLNWYQKQNQWINNSPLPVGQHRHCQNHQYNDNILLHLPYFYHPLLFSYPISSA